MTKAVRTTQYVPSALLDPSRRRKQTSKLIFVPDFPVARTASQEWVLHKIRDTTLVHTS